MNVFVLLANIVNFVKKNNYIFKKNTVSYFNVEYIKFSIYYKKLLS